MVDLAVVITTHRGTVAAEILAMVARMAPAEVHIVSSNEASVGALSAADDRFQIHRRKALLTPGAARNHGASKSRARNLLFLDHDVLLTEQALLTVEAFEHDDQAEIVGGLYEIGLDESPAQTFQNAFLAYRFDQCQEDREPVLSTSHLLVKREAFERIGGFHEQMTSQEDLEFCSRAIELGIDTRLDRGFLATHLKRFSTWSLIGDYFRKSRASIGHRLSNRSAMAHAANNLSRWVAICFLAPALASLAAVALFSAGVESWLPYAGIGGMAASAQPWRFYRLYLRGRPRLLVYSIALWPFIGLAVTGGSAVGLAGWWVGRLAGRIRSLLDYSIALKRVLIRDGSPIQLIAYCTAICNLRCNHCYYKETLDRPEKGELSLDVFERLIQGTKPLLWFSLGGGEPLVRSDLLELSKSIVGHGRPKLFSFPTSGWYTEATYLYALRLLQAFPDGGTQVALFVSIDGPEEVHDRIRGEGSYRRALATIERLRPLGRWYRHFHLNVVTTITRDNAAGAERFIDDLLRVTDPSSLSINLFRYHSLEHPPLEPAVIDGYERALAVHQEWSARRRRSGWGFWSGRVLRAKERLQKQIILRVARHNEFVTPCTAGQLSYVVMEDGRLKSCEILSEELGNVTSDDIGTLTRSGRAGALRRWIRDTRCRCTYECANSANALFSWPMVWDSLKAVALPGEKRSDA